MRLPARYLILIALALAMQPDAAVVKDHGAMRVQGNQVVDTTGVPIQVAGMSLFWPTYGGSKFYNPGAIGFTATDWKASVIRAPIPVVPSNGTPVYNQSDKPLIRAAIDAAVANDIYVVVDWHVEGDNSLTTESKAFFEEFAKAYGKVPNVIWEIWNEPVFDNAATKTRNVPSRAGTNGCDLNSTDPVTSGWNDIKSYSSEIIPIIRKYSENLILVGTPCWSRRADIAAKYPLDTAANPAFRNLAYAIHFYSCSHKDTLRDLTSAAADKIPLFFTEWGTSFDYGGGGVCTAEADLWLALAKQKSISWTNWSLASQGESSSALKGSAATNGGWKDDDLSESGIYVRGQIGKVGEGFPPTPVRLDTIELPGRFEAERYDSISSDGLVVETKSVVDLGYSSKDSWVGYSVRLAGAGEITLRANVATDESGSLTFKLDGVPLCTLHVSKTGGWDSWKVMEVAGVGIQKAGPARLRIEWGGDAAKVNLDWVELSSGSISVRHAIRPAELSFHAVKGGLEVDLGPPAGTATLTDLQGQTHSRSAFGETKARLHAPPGAAILIVRTHEGIWTERVIIP